MEKIAKQERKQFRYLNGRRSGHWSYEEFWESSDGAGSREIEG